MSSCMSSSQPVHSLPSRRDFLQSSGVGFGAIALEWLLRQEANAAAVSPLSQHVARAKSVIWLFMEGGPSHLDLVDPKPMLNELSGQPLPASFREPITAMGEKGAPLLGAPRTWKQHGESGLWASEWIPQHAIQGCGERLGVVGRHQEAITTMPDGLGRTRTSTGDHR